MKYTDLCAQAEKALEGVTEGPWEFIPAGNRPDVCRQGKWVDGYICAVESQNFVEDARFIAFTRAWVPAAAAAIRELEAERDAVWPTAEDVAEASEDGKGFWKSCSGCHETNEGVPTGPLHPVLKCYVGVGCAECGGIGAIWDTTDYADMGDWLAKQMDAPAPDAVEALVKAANALHADMLERARVQIDAMHGDQYRIVNAGRTAWHDFDAALAAIRKGATP